MRDDYQLQHPVTGELYWPMETPRFTEIPTFMRAPVARSLDGLDIALIGLPYDGAVSNRPGARHGPREIRTQSSMSRSTHHVTKVNPFELCRVADVGDVRLTRSLDVAATVSEIEAFYRHIHGAGVAPITAGGDHSITYPIYECPAGERLIYRFVGEESGKMLRRYWTSACSRCAIKSQCTTGVFRRVSRELCPRCSGKLRVIGALTDPLVIARIVRPVEYKTDKRPFPRSHRVSSGGQIVVNRRLDAVLAQISPRGQ